MKRTITFRITRLASVIAFIAAFATAAVAFRLERVAYRDGLDARLRAAAAAMPLLLPPDFHERALAGDVTPAETRRLLQRLDDHATLADIPLLYTYLRDAEGETYIAIGTPTPAMRGAGEAFDRLTPNPTPPRGVIEALETGRVQHTTYRSQYGNFRSCFFPVDTPSGLRYVAGADVFASDIAAWLLRRFLFTVGCALAVSLAVSFIGARIGRRIAGPFARLTEEVDRLQLASSDEQQAGEDAALRGFARAGDESGRLAAALLEMRERNVEQLAALRAADRARERVESELQVARQIQEALLPASPPHLKAYEIRGWNREMDEIGGDFYHWLGSDQVTVVLADVTGHGLPAALIAATCRARAETILEGQHDLAASLSRLNTMMSRDLVEGRFVTLVAATLDERTHMISVGSAGHGPTLHVAAATGAVTRIDTTGLPLGILPDQSFDADITVPMQPGDILLLVSDGITERTEASGVMFGEGRLAEALARAAAEQTTADGVLEAIRATVEAFAAGAPAADDATAVVIRRSCDVS